MLTDKTNSKIAQQIADATNNRLTADDVINIVGFQFEVVRDAMIDKRFVELPKLGRFYVKEGRDKHIEPEKRFYEPHMRSSSSTASEVKE